MSDGPIDHPVSDSLLVTACLSGSRDAFAALFDRHFASLRRVLEGQGCDSDLAQDLAQEAFIIAFRELSQLRNEDSFRPWLFKIGSNLLRQRWRRNRFHQTVSFDMVEDSTGVLPIELVQDPISLHTMVERDIVRAALAKLSPALREALLLRHFGGFSDEEISLITGVSTAAAQKRAYRATVQFRKWYVQLASDEQHVRYHTEMKR